MARLEPPNSSLIMVSLRLGPTSWLEPRVRQRCSVVLPDCRVPEAAPACATTAFKRVRGSLRLPLADVKGGE